MPNLFYLNSSISLPIKSEKRDVKVSEIVIPQAGPSVKKENNAPQKPSNSLFGAAAKSNARKDIKSEPSTSAQSAKTVLKQEKTPSPKKDSKSNAKNTKPTTGKSISSFFSGKPASSTQSASNTSKMDKMVSNATAKIEKVEIVDEPVEVKANGSKNGHKRSHSTSGTLITQNLQRKNYWINGKFIFSFFSF